MEKPEEKSITNNLRVLWNIILGLFVFISLPLVLLYLIVLYEKLVHSHVKSINDEEAVQLGTIAFIFLVVDVILIKKFVRYIRARFLIRSEG